VVAVAVATAIKRKSMLKIGDNVDSWCGKCKMMLAHTIEAMVGDKPARVLCNTCKAQHRYKAAETTTSKPAQPRKPRATKYQTLLQGKSTGVVKRYSTKESYQPGDVIEHPNFGVGVATALKDGSKIEMLFESGPKLLVHGR
jgi:hypothetical protein